MKIHNLRKADLHVHSSRSHDVPDFQAYSPRALFEAALGGSGSREPMDYFALTDHNTMAGYEELRRQLPERDRRLLIPGVEHTLVDPAIGFSIHVNLLGLSPDEYAAIRAHIVCLEDLSAYCRERGIYMQYNHPTWWEREELKAGRVSLWKVAEAADHFDVLELNAGRTQLLNTVTENLARAKGKFLTCNSDTHIGDVGKAFTKAPGDTVDEFLAAIWSGQAAPVKTDMTNQVLLAMVHSAIDELFNHRRGVQIKPTVLDSGSRRVDRVTQRILGSDRVMRNRVMREPLRALLKHAARPVVRGLMAHERRLERTLSTSPLSSYF